MNSNKESLDCFDPQAVILANGDYPTAEIPLKLLGEVAFVVCCDGGANEYIKRGFTPTAIVGDGDSLLPEYRSQFQSLIHRISDQETNDQTKSVGFLKERGIKRIAIVGATGKREDHTIGNISLLVEYMRKGLEVRSYTDYGVIVPCRNCTTFKCKVGQQVSIFNISAKGFKSEGLMYPIYDFTNWWQGTLNQTTSDSFTILADGEYILMVTY
ncbi:MAG: thiamine diphosphokinase [Marinifilaceae bacterium]|nr:thiamine diphosphokinase [Marinifilaceae bacterium]